MSVVTIEDVACAAWEATRPETALPFDQLEGFYRATLIKRAEAVLAGEWPADPWKAYETQVCQLADGRGNMQVGSERGESADEAEPETKPKKAAKKTKK